MDIKIILNQLSKIHYEEEWWINDKLPKEEIDKYHMNLIEKNRLLFYAQGEKLLGYVESWRLDYDQWGRIVCHESFSPCDNDVTHGDICYVANVWVDKEHRNSQPIQMLKNSFFIQNCDAKYFVGHALRKKTQPIKVLTLSQARKLYYKEDYGF